MNELNELVQVFRPKKLKNSDLLTVLLQRESKLEQLYTGILTGEITTDADATRLLYPDQVLGGKLSKLKQLLKERLLQIALLPDFQSSGTASRQEAYAELNKKWQAASLLMSRGARLTWVRLLENLLQQTLHFEFTELTLSITAALRLHYGTFTDNVQRYEHYRQLYQQYQRIWLMESEAEDLYTQLTRTSAG